MKVSMQIVLRTASHSRPTISSKAMFFLTGSREHPNDGSWIPVEVAALVPVGLAAHVWVTQARVPTSRRFRDANPSGRKQVLVYGVLAAFQWKGCKYFRQQDSGGAADQLEMV